MPKQDLTIPCQGLITAPSPHADSPPGGLQEASNVLITRANVVNPRPGFDIDDLTTDEFVPWSEVVYKGNTLLLCGNSYDVSNADSWEARDVGTGGAPAGELGSPPEPYYRRHATTQARENLYVTTVDGVKKADSNSATWRTAGMPRAYQPGEVSTTVSGAGWLVAGNTCAYQLCVVHRDVNGYEVRSAPSFPVNIPPFAGPAADRAVTLTSIPLNTVVVAGDTVEIYRTLQVDNATASPDAEYYLVEAHVVTSSEVVSSVREFTYVDTIPESNLGAKLYTSPSQQGALQENGEPPLSTEIATFNRMNFYADNAHKASGSLDFNGQPNGAGLGAAGAFARFAVISTGTTTAGSPVITGVSGVVGTLSPGMFLFRGTLAFPFFAPTESRVLSTTANTITMTTNATVSSTITAAYFYWPINIGGVNYYPNLTSPSVTASWDPRYKTFTSANAAMGSEDQQSLLHLARVINQNVAANVGLNESTVTAQVVFEWDPNTDLSSADANQLRYSLLLESRSFEDDSFEVYDANLYVQQIWKQSIASTSDASWVSRDRFPNELMISKVDEVEAVPPVNRVLIGSQYSKINRCMPTRDALWIFKEDGIWRLTGSTPESLRVDPYDATSRLVNCESVCSLGELVFAWTGRGVIAVSDSGITELSTQTIEPSISSETAAVMSLSLQSGTGRRGSLASAFMIADPNRRLIVIGVPSASATYQTRDFDETNILPCAALFVLSLNQSSWQTWDLQYQCGVYDTANNILRFGTWAEGPGLRTSYHERAESAANIPVHLDQKYPITNENINLTTGQVTFDYVSPVRPAFDVEVGDVIMATDGDGIFVGMSIITSVNANDDVVVDNVTAIDDADARFVVRGITSSITWRMKTSGNPQAAKRYWEANVSFQKLYYALNYTMSFSGNSEADGAVETPVLVANQAEASNSANNYPVRRCGIARQYQRSTDLYVGWSMRQGGCEFDLTGLGIVFDEVSTRTGR